MNVRARWDGNWPRAICVYANTMERERRTGATDREKEREMEGGEAGERNADGVTSGGDEKMGEGSNEGDTDGKRDRESDRVEERCNSNFTH